jgi:hypothetical protein
LNDKNKRKFVEEFCIDIKEAVREKAKAYCVENYGEDKVNDYIDTVQEIMIKGAKFVLTSFVFSIPEKK